VTEAETIFIIEDGGLGKITLNRPRVLNALSNEQYPLLAEVLTGWAADRRVGKVLIEGAGERAFSAGGDIRVAFDAWKRGDHAFNRALFRDEYRLDRLIAHYPKPYVAILDGIVMGGGAGVSVNGGFRVATERTLFAMPETGIGFFPDVGATHFLNRCPGNVGLYLGLSGARLGPADTLWAGLATHFVPFGQLDALRGALGAAAGSANAVAAVLARFHQDPGPAPLAAHAEALDRCFGRDGVAGIVAALQAEGSAWAKETAEAMAARSPFSLAVTFRQLTGGRGLGFDDAIRREFRLACRFLAGDDFFEGIRAQVVDKDRRPSWRPESLAEVDERAVAAYFAPLAEELTFS
jgi:enoyl-CoA hydratase